jgi:hypothetical protein
MALVQQVVCKEFKKPKVGGDRSRTASTQGSLGRAVIRSAPTYASSFSQLQLRQDRAMPVVVTGTRSPAL